MIRIRYALMTAAAVGLYAYGVHVGETTARADALETIVEAQRAAVSAANETARREAQRLAAEAERDAIAAQLEGEAYDTPPSDVCALPVDRVRRLNLR